jgi:hypothetical protein
MVGLPDRSAYAPVVATAARPVIEAAGRLVTAAGIEGFPDRSEYAPEVATDARPVTAEAARLVVGAATEIVPSDAAETLAPIFTPPSVDELAAGNV